MLETIRMTYIELLSNAGVTIPECYKAFRANEDFEQYSGMVVSTLDKDVYSETTEVNFDWDEYMFEEFFDSEMPEYIPIAILHDTEIIDDAYFAIKADDPNCAIYHCEINEETEEVEYGIIADSISSLIEQLNYPEENFIEFMEKKYSTSLPERYKKFIQTYEYNDYNGEKTYNDTTLLFNEFANLQWAAENFNKESLEWLPFASIGEDFTEYNDVLAIKMGTEDCPIYFINGEETELVSKSLNEFLSSPSIS